jgi:hypothetical protein
MLLLRGDTAQHAVLCIQAEAQCYNTAEDYDDMPGFGTTGVSL